MAVRSGKVPLRPIEFSFLLSSKRRYSLVICGMGPSLRLTSVYSDEGLIKMQSQAIVSNASLLDCNRDDDARQDQSQ